MTPGRPRIAVIGSINMDLVTRVARRPMPGETILGESFSMVHGGKGANQAVAASRLGADVLMIGRVGEDAFADELLASLRREGIDTRHVRKTPGSSGVASIVVDDTGENSIIVTPGANAHLSTADIDAATADLATCQCVLLQLETSLATVGYAVALCRRLKCFTILDPAPAPNCMPPELFAVNLLTPNEWEGRMLLGGSDSLSAEDVGRQLLGRGAAIVVQKLGHRGAMWSDEKSNVIGDGFSIEPIDTTAAGDAFTAALAVARCENTSAEQTLIFANAAGALACLSAGARPSMPTRKEVDVFISRHGRDIETNAHRP